MPSLRNVLHRRNTLTEKSLQSAAGSGKSQGGRSSPPPPPPPEITFLRTDTFGQEEIIPPSREKHASTEALTAESPLESPTTSRRSFFLPKSNSSQSLSTPSPPRSRERRLSNLLHRNSRRVSQESSTNIPEGLPQIEDDQAVDKQEREAQWEKRATVLVQNNPHFGQIPASPVYSQGDLVVPDAGSSRSRSSSQSRVGDHQDDVNIQEAIRLHEEGDLERSTTMFGQLADPNGHNNALSQVLYGLALRHGWGCTKDETRAVEYLSAAATNSAAVESEALRAGMKKGGNAKGELVLAIFELANCFRMGWGVKRDPAAARQYYETAANLGDTDAMDHAAWCYLEGFGGKKDKFKAAKYYRLAEENGNPTVGNSWIWKDKYNPK
ncbi:Uncharacterized protein PECH_001938 [Penicillium ucsense]|uniref:HCP-like protein n=1 Tax=Penicillium ucsense TaxID=2839758 RepID=A0A8J8WGE8_9EURO|nr:Uncharacterized protein PECM_008426 [Penicillium ucsense]KAF7731500.1 Uncharacterized protein PECH_001938 [Penicillium ucsense]